LPCSQQNFRQLLRHNTLDMTQEMSTEGKLLGLIGYPLSHSFSQSYFRKKFSADKLLANYDYLNFPIEDISLLPQLIVENPQLIGFNVTIPYKEQVMSYLNDIDPIAKKIGAVNTVKITRGTAGDYKLKGYNTDVYGFEHSLLPFLQKHHKKALILGTGGASKAVAYVLKNLNIDFLFVSRIVAQENTISYADLDEKIMNTYNLIINTTPLGMHPNIQTMPEIPYGYIDKKFLLYDLVYNPAETRFLLKGKEKGAIIVNGYKMLVFQAEKAWEIFIG